MNDLAEERRQMVRYVIERALIQRLDKPPLVAGPRLPDCEPDSAPVVKGRGKKK